MSVSISLRSGQVALVDDSDADAVAGYKWTWMRGRGVAAYLHAQTILMHNLIAPFSAVSFKDGDKLNCRRENLIQHKPAPTARRREYNGKNIWDDTKQARLTFHRRVVECGELFHWSSSVSYRFAGKAKAMRMAEKAVAALKAMSREDFIEFVKFSREKKTRSQAICDEVSEWSAFGGEVIRAGGYRFGELAQLGLSNREDQ